MKTLTIFLALLPTLLFAQKDSVKVTYSQEEVANFEKPTFIDEYEKAFGGKVVKSALKVGLDVGYNFDYHDGGINDFLKRSNSYFISFEQKISKSISINVNANYVDLNSGVSISNSLIYGYADPTYVPPTKTYKNYLLAVEPRWYFKMKKRILASKQADNLTGRYFGVRFLMEKIDDWHWSYPFLVTSFIPQQKLGFVYGHQFGKSVDYSICLGIQNAKEVYVNDLGKLVLNDNNPSSLSFFIYSSAKISIGQEFPTKSNANPTDKCAFLKCNYAVNHLFKFNTVNNVNYNKFVRNLKFEFGYEQKLGKSSFSINTEVQIENSSSSYFGRNPVAQANLRDFSTYTFQNVLNENSFFKFSTTLQLRCYPFMKKRMLEGSSANNLSGTYLGLAEQFNIISNLPVDTFSNTIFTAGHQQQLAHNFYLDYGLNINFWHTWFYDTVLFPHVKMGRAI